MEKKALLTIIGRQDYNGDKDKIEMQTVGTIDQDDNCYIIKYDEQLENNLTPINATLNIAKDRSRVEMIKSGPFSSCLIIERSKRNLCKYGTEYGDMLMGIFGKSIETNFGEKDGSFDFCYEIDVNGAVSSQNDVTIKYRITE